LRVLSISTTVFRETNAASRAAALSFSSLLGLGPLIAIAVLVAGVLVGERNPEVAVDSLNRMLHFVLPQIDQLERVSDGESVAVNQQLIALLNGFIAGAKSSSVGVVGALSLILIVLFLFKSIEDVFNEIWGVRRGRSWIVRVVYYWTVLTLGAVLFFTALALVGAGAFVTVFVGRLPFGAELARLLRWSLPLVSFLLLVGVLAVFYRAIPNTRVRWGAAFAGAAVVGALLLLNNLVAFLYLRRVLLTRSLYGSLGILPVLMFGLYIFWLCVLVGGQISYAVQNVRHHNSQIAWHSLSAAAKERLTFVVLLAICRRFHRCEPAIPVSGLGPLIPAPTQVLNECLNRLADMQLVTAAPQGLHASANDPSYQPSRPLSRIVVGEFKRRADRLGDDPLRGDIRRSEPLVDAFDAAVASAAGDGFFQRTIQELLDGEKAGA